MHKNAVVPSTYHPSVKYRMLGAHGTIMGENDPFPIVEAYHAESRFYKANRKGKADDTNISTMIIIRHPLARFTCPMTALECGKIATYHCFQVPKRKGGGGGLKKPITFHVLGDTENVENTRMNPIQAQVVLESQYSFEVQMIREGVEREFCRIRDRERVPPSYAE